MGVPQSHLERLRFTILDVVSLSQRKLQKVLIGYDPCHEVQPLQCFLSSRFTSKFAIITLYETQTWLSGFTLETLMQTDPDSQKRAEAFQVNLSFQVSEIIDC